MRTADFLSRLKGIKPIRKDQWLALCPGHHDTKQSLSVKEADGKILIKCFAGCELKDILKPLGLETKDLSLDSHEAKLEHREIEAIYHYTDANGKPFEVVRTRPKGFYQRQPDGMGGYLNNLKGIVPTLYHQNEFKQAIDSTEPVYFVEGEKDADRLWSLGLIATTNPMGAGKWRNNYTEALRGADLIIIPDNDPPGREHANHVAKSCYGVAGRIHLLRLPDEFKDVSDWLDNGGTRQELERLANEAPEWKPSQAQEAVTLVCMADVEAETVDWLWSPYIPLCKLTLLEGDPGVGKSWVSLAIAAGVSLGKGLPGVEATESASVLLASAEDGLGDTIRPRLDALGANVANIHAVNEPITFDNGGLARLEADIQEVRPALVVIDPLVAYLGARVDIHRSNETRAIMSQLARIAEKYSVAILCIRHLTKGGAARPIYRGLGSIDFTASCRSVLLVGYDPENPQKRGIVQIKSNLAPMGNAIGFELRDGNFYWTGESDLTAGRILSAEDGEGKSTIDEAIDFLRDGLAEGPILAKDVYRDAEGVGISKRTLERAKSQIGIKARRQGEKGKRGSGAWVWELPTDLDRQDIPLTGEGQSQNDLHRQHRQYKEFGDLNHSEAKKEIEVEGLGDLNLEAALGIPCIKGRGVCELRTDAGRPFSCAFTPENCQFRRVDNGVDMFAGKIYDE